MARTLWRIFLLSAFMQLIALWLDRIKSQYGPDGLTQKGISIGIIVLGAAIFLVFISRMIGMRMTKPVTASPSFAQCAVRTCPHVTPMRCARCLRAICHVHSPFEPDLMAHAAGLLPCLNEVSK